MGVYPLLGGKKVAGGSGVVAEGEKGRFDANISEERGVGSGGSG